MRAGWNLLASMISLADTHPLGSVLDEAEGLGCNGVLLGWVVVALVVMLMVVLVMAMVMVAVVLMLMVLVLMLVVMLVMVLIWLVVGVLLQAIHGALQLVVKHLLLHLEGGLSIPADKIFKQPQMIAIAMHMILLELALSIRMGLECVKPRMLKATSVSKIPPVS